MSPSELLPLANILSALTSCYCLSLGNLDFKVSNSRDLNSGSIQQRLRSQSQESLWEGLELSFWDKHCPESLTVASLGSCTGTLMWDISTTEMDVTLEISQ